MRSPSADYFEEYVARQVGQSDHDCEIVIETRGRVKCRRPAVRANCVSRMAPDVTMRPETKARRDGESETRMLHEMRMRAQRPALVIGEGEG
jgi:hypothetical protein